LTGLSTNGRTGIDTDLMNRYSIFICDIKLAQSHYARLMVSPSTTEADVWIWSYSRAGEIIGDGKATKRLAAQVAAQHMHEAWLNQDRERVSVRNRIHYRWEEVEY